MPQKKKQEASEAEPVTKTMKKEPDNKEPEPKTQEKPEPFELDDILKGNVDSDESGDSGDSPKIDPDEYSEYKRAYDFLMSLPQDKFDQLTGTAQTQQPKEPTREEPSQANIPQFPNYDDYPDNAAYNRAVQEYNASLLRANNDAVLKQVERVVGDKLEQERIQRQQQERQSQIEVAATRLKQDLEIDERTWQDFTRWMNEPAISPYDRLKASYGVYRIDKGKVPKPQATQTETNNRRRIPSISEMSGVTYAGDDENSRFSGWLAELSKKEKRYFAG